MLGEVILGYDVYTVGAVRKVGLGLGGKGVRVVKIDVGANLYVKYVIS